MRISEAARRVRQELDFAVGQDSSVPMQDLGRVCDELYMVILDVWTELVVESASRRADELSLSFVRLDWSDHTTFRLDGVPFVLHSGPSISRPRILFLKLQSALFTTDDRRFLESSLDLDSTGRYQEVRIELDQNLSAFKEEIEEVTLDAISAGERWIDSFALMQIGSLQDDPVASLYHLVRSPFPPEIGEAIRLYLIDPHTGGGVFMDDIARRRSLSQISEFSYDAYDRAPVEILAELLTARFPISETVAREIVPDMQTIAKPPMEIPSASKVGLAQHIIYEAGPMVLQPLICTEKLWIEAAYPIRIRDAVEPVLQSEIDVIAEGIRRLRFGRVSSPEGLDTTRHTRRRKGSGKASERWAGVAGRFIGGFTEGYIS